MWTRKNELVLALVGALSLAGETAVAAEEPWDTCFDNAGERYGVAPALLRAIARKESRMNPFALNTANTDGSYDQGVMQINSRWRDTLRAYGITPASLWDPCTNINVGAWILADNVARYGYTWSAVGAYNAGTGTSQNAEVRRTRYAQEIADELNRLRRHRAAGGLYGARAEIP